jgi:dTMP kinase
MFVVLEGCDRVGKSTQCAMLAECLPKAKVFRFPNRNTASGQQLDMYLKGGHHSLTAQDVHDLFVLNRRESAEDIKRLLADGWVVIADRYSYSGMAYSRAKGLTVLPEEHCIRPDVIILLTLSEAEHARRLANTNAMEIYENDLSFQRQVADEFLKFKYDLIVDGNQTRDVINKAIVDLLYTLRSFF